MRFLKVLGLCVGLFHATAYADVVFESASLGSGGQVGGADINGTQFVGARFELLEPHEITAVGGHLGSFGGTLFAAIVPLDSMGALPASTNVPSIALEITHFTNEGVSGEWSFPLEVALDAGTYAIIFGGTSPSDSGFMPGVDVDLPDASYFVRDGAGNWQDGGITNSRFFVEGTAGITVPAPFAAITGIADLNGNGSAEVAVTVPGSTRVHIRDGSTDALISDINFGNDLAFGLTTVPDLDASGDPEIALLNQQDTGQVRIQIRDSMTGNIAKNLWYGSQYDPVAMIVVPDYSGNAFPEMAVLGSAPQSDAMRVQLRDSQSNAFVDNVFLGTQSLAADLISVVDTSGNGIPEVGILGILKANDHVRMQVWDADTAAFQVNVWFGNVYQPQSAIVVPDINSNGSDEIVGMGVDPATQNIRVQVRDSDTTNTLFNIWLGNVNKAVGLARINDINNDGYDDIAVLLETPAGVGRVRVQDGKNGAFIRNLFFSAVEAPVDLTVLPDYSGNGFDELAVLGGTDAVRHVQILDTATGIQVNRIDFPTVLAPNSLQKVTGDPTEVLANAPIVIAVRVLDGNSEVVANTDVNWSVLFGGGSLSDLATTTDENGIATVTWTTGTVSGVNNILRARSAEIPATLVDFATIPEDPLLPLYFANDAGNLSASNPFQAEVLDQKGRLLPTNDLTFSVERWIQVDPANEIAVDGNGLVTQINTPPQHQAFRVRAAYLGTPIDSIVMVVSYRIDQDYVLIPSAHWRFFFPSDWETRANANVPDFEAAMDAGADAQRQLYGGVSAAELMTINEPENWLPFDSLADYPPGCAWAGQPIALSHECMFSPSTGDPRWSIIFHELGHNNTGRHGYLAYDEYFAWDSNTWVEGDASILGIWSMREMAMSMTLSDTSRNSVQGVFDGSVNGGLNRIANWEASGADWLANFSPNELNAVQIAIAEEYGWDYIPRFVRAWRIDAQITSIMGSDVDRPTSAERGTFTAAAISAAVQQDLSQRFIDDWRFPLDMTMFNALYARFLIMMDVPY